MTGQTLVSSLSISRRFVRPLHEAYTKEDAMGVKGEALATQFEAKAQEAAHILERVTAADWQKVTEAEKWSVGVTAHHLATSYDRVPDIAKGLAAGQSFGNFTRKMLDERNAQHAKEFTGCTKEETLALHRKGRPRQPPWSAASATSNWRRAGS